MTGVATKRGKRNFGSKKSSFKKHKPKMLKNTKKQKGRFEKDQNTKLNPSSHPEEVNSQTEQQEANVSAQLEQISSEGVVKKFKKDQFFMIKQKLNSSEWEKEATAKMLESKIKAIESRGVLTNTAMRKLRQLKKYKKLAEGGEMAPAPSKNPNPISKSAKRRERRKLTDAKDTEDKKLPTKVKNKKKLKHKNKSNMNNALTLKEISKQDNDSME